MKNLLGKAALAAVLSAPLAAPAMAAPKGDTIATKPDISLETQMKQQQQRIEAQDARIEELEQKLSDLGTILQNRVDRVEAATDSGKVINTNPGPRIEGPNQRNSMNFIGAIQTTISGIKESKPAGSTAPELHSGTEIKRARLGVQGVAFSDFAYAAEVDLSTTTGSISNAARDLWVQYNGWRPFAVTIGNMKTQNGLEASFSDRSNAQTFIESSMLTTMMQTTGTRGVGGRISTGGTHWSTSWGVFGDDVNNNNNANLGGEGWGGHGRVTWAPVADATHVLHFGVSGFSRKIAEDNTNVSQFRVRAQPENTVDATRLVDTGNITNAHLARLLSLESAGLIGPIGYQAEWGQMNVDRTGGRPDLSFNGAYVGVNWFLTGESRVYDPRTGVFSRFVPKYGVDPANGKWGAWELAGRWSNVDFNSHEDVVAGPTFGVRGGEETNYTLGVNWYWNPYFRVMMNYVRADADKKSNTNVDQSATLDQLSVRIQQEW